MAVSQSVPGVYPEALLDSANPADPANCWWVLLTRARHEKALARDLFERRIAYYLPLVRRRIRYRRNSVTRYLPLFPSYLFLHGSDEDRVKALATNRLSRILGVNNPLQLQRDLLQLQRLIESGAPLTPESRLSPGNRVRIKGGPLAGIEGTVLKRRSETRLLVSVCFLQQGASIAIDDFDVEMIH